MSKNLVLQRYRKVGSYDVGKTKNPRNLFTKNSLNGAIKRM
jgi:hypothetical protein